MSYSRSFTVSVTQCRSSSKILKTLKVKYSNNTIDRDQSRRPDYSYHSEFKS